LEEGIEKGMEKGIEKGIEKGMENVAKLMKTKGKQVLEIIELTGLTSEQIGKL